MAKPNLQLERVRELIAVMRESGVSELAIEFPDFKVSLKRDPVDEEAAGAQHPDRSGQPSAAEAPGASAQGPALLPVAAALVGTFRAADEHGQRVAPGDSVSRGQVIGAIEAMRVPNDIVAPAAGVVREVLASDGAPVEYGQLLMLIEPLAATEGAGVETESL
jgi:acetyl-CoA carboxylase biotin carboxyl carrier protein